MSAPGNMVFVEGDAAVKDWLQSGPERVDDWLYELVDWTVFYAAERIKTHAPGSIDELVDVDLPKEYEPGAIQGIAGVEPSITESTFHSGLGSDPADFPVFVEVGTGIFGPVDIPISTIPGYLMGPFTDKYSGLPTYVREYKGQKAQHYTEDAFEDTVGWLPAEIRLRLPDLGSRE